MIIVLTAEGDGELAESLSRELLKRKLAACVTISETKSMYWWEGEIKNGNEVQLLIKTTNDQLVKLLEGISELHSYNTPEIIYWEVSSSLTYGKWVEDSTSFF